MPKRTDLRSILIVGSGPIRIGQGCEFDYSGAQACRVLRREGYRVVLVNSNPATIMTDPEWADATYLEPLDVETVAEVIERERPDALLPTLGGQTALNLAVELREAGVLDRYGVELIGADLERDPPRRGPRALPRRRCTAAGLPVPRARSSSTSPSVETSRCRRSCGRRSRSAARGGGIAHTREELAARDRARPRREPGRPGARRGVPRRLAGVRARGDVRRAPATASSSARSRTSTRWASTRATRGRSRRSRRCPTPSTSGCARRRSRLRARRRRRDRRRERAVRRTSRRRDELRVIEMNPRVSRSSALASKATGFPIAKLAALLAVGYTLDELPNDITRQDDRRVRAGARLRRGQGAALRLREVPAAPSAGSARDARRRRGARARADVPEAFLKALDGREARDASRSRRRRRAASRARRAGARALGPAARGGAARARPAGHPPVLRRTRASREVLGRRRDGRAAAAAPGRLAVDSCAGEFEARTPYYYLSYEADGRGAGADGPRGDRARRGPEPDRPGDRVRLLLRPRGAGAPRSSATRRCSSTRTRRRSRPTTTPPTGSTSSR